MAAPTPSCKPGFQWMNNPQGVSPCIVAFDILNIACTPKQGYTMSSLSDDSTYSAPSDTQADPCLCNVPMYSLISACAFCQGQQLISFGTWTAHCTPGIISNSSLPNTTALPTDLPSFAYIPLNASNFFDVNAAHSPSTAPPTSPTKSTQPPSPHTGTNLQIVITVVVAATLFLIILLLITLLIYRSRHSKGGKGYFRLSYGRNSDHSRDSATVIDSASPPGWLSRIPLPRFLRMSITGRVSPYQPGNHPTLSNDPKAQTPLAAASALSLASVPVPNASPPLYQVPNQSQQSLRSMVAPERHVARRIETLPVMQSIVRPTPNRSMSADTRRERMASPGPINNTSAPTIRRPDRITTVSRPAGFKIEDTPVATQHRAPWGNLEAPPAFDASAISLKVFASSENDSDSIRSPPYGDIYEGRGGQVLGEKHALTTPPSHGYFPVSPPSSVRQLPVSPPLTARHPPTPPANVRQYPNSPPGHATQPGTPPANPSQYPSSPPLNVRQLPLTPDVRKMPSNQSLRNQASVMIIGGPSHGREGSRTFPPPPTRKESFASITFTNFDTDTNESNFGSSQPPMSSVPLSPAMQSSHAHRLVSDDDHIKYGGPESRINLFPDSVRAAGYAGVPPSDE